MMKISIDMFRIFEMNFSVMVIFREYFKALLYECFAIKKEE